MKQFIRSLTPPIILKTAKKVMGSSIWSGDYSNWKDALNKCSTYAADNILEKVANSLQLVKNGKAAFERDSVAFEKMDWNFPLLSSLLYASKGKQDSFSVLDIGGSLGSTYYQYSGYLSHIKNIDWVVAEQPSFVKKGRENFSNSQLTFTEDLDSALKKRYDLILLSSCLQYFENPYDLMKKIIGSNSSFLIIDRTPFSLENRTRLTIQNVPKSIYEASYPCWFLEKEKIFEFTKNNYKEVWNFETSEKAEIPSEFKGFLFELK